MKSTNHKETAAKVELSGKDISERIRNVRNYLKQRNFIIQTNKKERLNIPLNRAVIITILAPRLVALFIIIALIAKCTLKIEED